MFFSSFFFSFSDIKKIVQVAKISPQNTSYVEFLIHKSVCSSVFSLYFFILKKTQTFCAF
jgi:hypothetical protein